MVIDVRTDRGTPAGETLVVERAGTREEARGTLAKGTSAGTLRIKPPKGRTDVVFRTVTLAPGDSTGWHHHPGQIIAVVQSGTLTRFLHDCSVETVSAGEAFVELAGRRNRHIGHNFGTEPVVLYMTCLLPQGAPLAIEAEAPDCALRLT
ncbi:cupin domain-containing protein [Streptomyces sp. NPDC058579]|uniref:cupin domain-containing protein n=1 Tax=Streptomyces sp. NPDC058579 TaxID=3346548 RepID=UPI003662F1BF